MIKKIKNEFAKKAGYSLDIRSLFARSSLLFFCSFFAVIPGP